jgi:hypothetical protein
VIACLHENFDSRVGIHRLVDDAGLLTGFQAEITLKCSECDQPFVFLGLPVGLSLDGAAVSIDGQELRVACAPSFDWVGPSKDIGARGFAVKFVRGAEKGGNQ